MLFTTWVTFFMLTVVATGSPGPGSLLALSSGLYNGPKRALFTIAGSLFGLFILFMVTVLGLYSLFSQYPMAFKFLALCGVAYLAYVGLIKWQQKNTAWQDGNNKAKVNTVSNFGLFREGFLVAISNPKIILFFSIFFTPFISIHESWMSQITILAVTFFVCELVWQLVYATGGDKLNTLFTQEKHYVLFNKVVGLFFIGSACFIGFNISRSFF